MFPFETSLGRGRKMAVDGATPPSAPMQVARPRASRSAPSGTAAEAAAITDDPHDARSPARPIPIGAQPRCRHSKRAQRSVATTFYRLFIFTALAIGLTSGFTLGAGLVLGYVTQTWLRAWLPHAQVHGHTQVWGWTLLFSFGVLLHVLPRLRLSPVVPQRQAVAVYGLVLAGLVTRALGQPLADQPFFAALLGASGVLELLGVTLAVAIVVRIARRGVQPRGLFERYLDAALRWLWLGTALEAWAALQAARVQALLLPGPWHEAALTALLWGFITLLIGGFSVRVVTQFLRLPLPDARLATWAARLLEGGVALSVAGALAHLALGSALSNALGATGALLLLAGALALVHSLHLCPLSQLRTPLAPGTAWYAVFLRAAYLWLLVAAGVGAAQAVAALVDGQPGYFALNGARHALTLGFITMIIMGMAARLLPAFSGRAWRGRELLWVSFVALNAAALLRTTLQPTLGYGGAGAILGVASLLGLLSYALFAAAIVRTLRARSPADTTEGQGIAGG